VPTESIVFSSFLYRFSVLTQNIRGWGLHTVIFEWLQDLGMPKALWVFDVEEFGPLTIAIDSHGNNLFEEVKRKAEESRTKIYEKLGA